MNLSLDEYLEGLGFKLERKKRSTMSTNIEEIKETLITFYPNFSYPAISDIEQRDIEFYRKVRKYTIEHSITYGKLLDNLGFEKINTYDRLTIINLINDYKAKTVDFANLFGVSRQAVDSETKKEINKIPFWKSTQLDSDEVIVFEGMINQFIMFHSEDSKVYRIFSNIEPDNPKFALLIKASRETRVVFDLPAHLEKLLLQQNFHVYNEIDLSKLKELIELLNISGNIKRPVTEDELKLLNHLTQKSKNSPFIKEDLFKYYGFNNLEIIDKRFVSDDDIRKVLDSFNDSELGFVKIPIDSEEYYRIVHLARNRGLSLGEFIQSFGYSYQRRPDYAHRNEQRKKALGKYIVRKDEVYISSYDPFYYNLSSLARKRNMSLDPYLLDVYNLKRLQIDELPDDYEQYNWRQYIVDLDQEEQFINYIDENLLLDENKVYVDSQSIFYIKLFLHAVQFDQDVTGLLNGWGYERTYDKPENFQKERFDLDNELRIRKDLMDQIIKIQGDLEKEQNTTERIKRSSALVNLLKVLYLDKCQLCDYENESFIPIISMNNGRDYIEVHHIRKITSDQSPNDETDIELDSYKNVIVVCAHHHKVLHFENGGYEKILINKIENKLYFENSLGILPVITDYHLSEKFEA